MRPAGFAVLLGLKASRSEVLTLAFFGIRSVGSTYYIAYGLNHAAFPAAERLWALVGLIILLSILLHALTVTPILLRLYRQQGRNPDAPKREAVLPPALGEPAA